MSSPVKRRESCRLCNSLNVVCVVTLQPIPLSENYSFDREDARNRPRYPIDLYLYMCVDCGHVQHLDVIDPAVWLATLIALNTGLREGKIYRFDRSRIKKERDGLWYYPPVGTSHLKGVPKKVPLNRIAVAALAEIVPSVDGRIFRRWNDIRALKKAWERVCERTKVYDLHFHDLRHTFTTRLQRLGVDYEVRQALLGHRMRGMTDRYSHGGPEWDMKLREAVTKLEKVYPMAYRVADRKVVNAGSMERETGFEPATLALARRCSTTELFPLSGFGR